MTPTTLFKKLVNGATFGELCKNNVPVVEKMESRKVDPPKDNQYMVISKGKFVGWENM